MSAKRKRDEVLEPRKKPTLRKVFDEKRELRSLLGKKVLEPRCLAKLKSRGLPVSNVKYKPSRRFDFDPPLEQKEVEVELDIFSGVKSIMEIENALSGLQYEYVWRATSSPETASSSSAPETASSSSASRYLFYGECALCTEGLTQKKDQLKKHMKFLCEKLSAWGNRPSPQLFISVIISSASVDLTTAREFLDDVRNGFYGSHPDLVRHFASFAVIRLPILTEDLVSDLVVISESLQCKVLGVESWVENSLTEFSLAVVGRVESLEEKVGVLESENVSLKERVGVLESENVSLRSENVSLKERVGVLESEIVLLKQKLDIVYAKLGLGD